MEPMRVGGLVSGLDTNAIIDGLSSIEQRKVQRLEALQQREQLRLSAWGDLTSRMQGLVEKGKALSDPESLAIFRSTTSDSDVAALTVKSGGLEGAFSLEVRQLASAWTVSSGAQSSSTTPLGMAGTMRFSRSATAVEGDPTRTTVDVSITAADSLRDVVARINAADGIGVRASLLTLGSSDTRLMLTSVDGGANAFSLTDHAGTTAQSLGLLATGTARSTSEFVLQMKQGGPATLSTTFGELFHGLGSGAVVAGDGVRVTGTAANGSAVDATFAPPNLSTSTMSDFLSWMGAQFGSTATLGRSGEIVLSATGATGNLAFTAAMSPSSQGTIALGGSRERSNFGAVVHEGRNAFYSLNGIALTSASNTDETSLQGASLSLRATTSGTPVQLTVARDDTAIQTAVQGLVDAFNLVTGFLNEKTRATIRETTDENGRTVRTRVGSELGGDLAATTLRSELRSRFTSTVTELEGKTSFTSLASVGIMTRVSDGFLEIDTKRFGEAIKNDFDGVTRLLASTGWANDGRVTVGGFSRDTRTGVFQVNPAAGTIDGAVADRTGDALIVRSGAGTGMVLHAPASVGTNVEVRFVRGIAGGLENWVRELQRPGGLIHQARRSLEGSIDSFAERISTQQDRVESFRRNLTTQFGSLERSLLRLSTQNSAFMAQIGSLS